MDEGQANGSAQSAPMSKQQTWLIVGTIALIVILIIVGLFLPPISLGERLGLGGDDATQAEASGELGIPGELALTIEGSDQKVKVSKLAQQEFLNKGVGEEWTAAADAIPTDLTLSSPVYALSYKGDTPQGSANVVVPAEAQPYQTLDLYGWDGEGWIFIPSMVAGDGGQVTSAVMPLPQAYALMQTTAPAEPAIGAEVLPARTLPEAVLPNLTEVTVGTLTLSQDGSLLGEAATVPGDGYRKYLRVTNTGAIVDTVSLSAVLSDPSAQQTNIGALVDQAKAGDYAGINLDYQGADANQRAAFTAFVRDLAQALHGEGLMLVVTLEAPVEQGDQLDTAGQDWAAIGQVADAVYAQLPLDPAAYGDGGPAEQVVLWATRNVDRHKLSALVSANPVDAVGDARREVANSQALENFGEITFVEGAAEVEPGEGVELALSGSASTLEWDPASLSYKYTYEQAGQPHSVWLSSEALLSHRSRFGNRYNLRGLAIRGLDDLSQADGYAAAIGSYLGEAEAPQPASAAIVWAVEDESGGVVASSSGETTAFTWDGTDQPGNYVVKAELAHGDQIASLGSVDILVREKATPTPTAEPTSAPVAEAEAEATEAPLASAPANLDPGNADAVVKTPANLRKGPGLGYGIIGGINPGEKVSLTGRNNERTWFQIKLANATEGWIFGELLTINNSFNANALAVVEVEPPAGAVSGGAAPAPVIAPAAGGSFELGGQTHSLANPTLMRQAGMNWVKFQHKWGPGDAPGAVAGRIQQAHANGFKVLLSIPGANAYPSSIDFAAYVEFLRGVAALGPDAIEIWNEENIDFEWPAGQIDPASYVNNMLAPAYNAIKSANSSVMVISGAPAPTGFDNGTNAWSDQRFMAGVAAAGGASYMDCIGVHHNAGATSPNAASGHPANSAHYSWYFFPTLNMYYNALGGARPVCFTELGYLSGQDFGGVPSRFSWASGTTVAQHAQWLAEAASLAANSGKVRLMIIFNVDFTLYGDDPQAGYAILRPDGSCPACGLLGQVMGR